MKTDVTIPKPDINAPSADDGLNWMQKAADAVTNMSPAMTKIVVIAILAMFVAYWLRRSPFLKGAVAAVIIGGILMVAFT